MKARERAAVPGIELEAKFVLLNAADLERLAEIRRFGPYRVLPRARDQLCSVYFDTPELSLLRERVSLRVRRKRGRFEATAKWFGKQHGAIYERPELSVALPDDPGRAFAVPEGPLRERLCAIVAGRKLRPVLITEIERRVAEVLPPAPAPNAVAELALDRVRLREPAPRPVLLEQYAELELELRSGTRADLESLTRRLREGFGLRPAKDSKFARGMALRLGHPLPREAGPPPLALDDSLDTVAGKLIAGLLSRMRESDPGTRRGEDPEALHELRVAVRRARAALRVFEAGFTPSEAAYFARELRWLGRELGAVRDVDVQLAALDAALARAPRADQRAAAAYRAHLRARWSERRAGLVRVLDSRRYFRLLIRLERFAAGERSGRARAAGRAPIALAAPGLIEAPLRKLRKRGRKLARRGEAPSAEELHVLRIRAKRARYTLEFLEELTCKPGARLVKRLRALQELLGEHQDAVVAAEFIAGYLAGEGAHASPAAKRVLGRVLADAQARAAAARATFPKVFRKWNAHARSELPALLRVLRAGAPGASPMESRV